MAGAARRARCRRRARPGSRTASPGSAAGPAGLGNESGGFLVNGVSFTFSSTQELLDPPTPPSPPMLGGVASSTVYAAGQGAVPVSPGLTLDDPDSATIAGATIAITAGGF